MKKLLLTFNIWRDNKRLEHIADMSQHLAFIGMTIFAFVASYFGLLISQVYPRYVIAVNEHGLSWPAVYVGVTLGAAGLFALCFGLLFQVCNKVFINNIFEKNP